MSDREALANRQQPAAPSGIIGRSGAPVTIGMLRNRERPTFSALAAAHAAVMQGAKLIFFSAADVDIVAENIRGWTYEHGGWRRVSSRLPDVIINDQSSIRHREIWDALQARVPFTSPLIGDKIEIMRRMEEGDFYRRLQIPTRRLTSFSVLLNMIERHGRIVVKPKDGSKREGRLLRRQVEMRHIRSMRMKHGGNVILTRCRISTQRNSTRAISSRSATLIGNENVAYPSTSAWMC